jgi:hypothetical protein
MMRWWGCAVTAILLRHPAPPGRRLRQLPGPRRRTACASRLWRGHLPPPGGAQGPPRPRNVFRFNHNIRPSTIGTGAGNPEATRRAWLTATRGLRYPPNPSSGRLIRFAAADPEDPAPELEDDSRTTPVGTWLSSPCRWLPLSRAAPPAVPAASLSGDWALTGPTGRPAACRASNPPMTSVTSQAPRLSRLAAARLEE